MGVSLNHSQVSEFRKMNGHKVVVDQIIYAKNPAASVSDFIVSIGRDF